MERLEAVWCSAPDPGSNSVLPICGWLWSSLVLLHVSLQDKIAQGKLHT